MNDLFQDMRFAVRMMRRNISFTMVAALSLALGIGANTAIFSLVNSVLLEPLAYHEPDRLVMVWEEASFLGFPENTPSPANYADWKAQNQVFEDMAALDTRSFNLTGDGEPEKIQAYGVTASFFSILGVKPALGRAFLEEEDRPEAARVTVISHGLWQRRFGSDPSIIGKEILLTGEKYTVVGVMPAGFQFLAGYIGLWVPMAFSPQDIAMRGDHYLEVVARMKPGVTLDQANTDIKTIMARIARDYPDDAGQLGAYVESLRQQLTGDVSRPLVMLFVAVGFVLLIACANIANLLLSRASSRRREMAVRSALGAGRGRIVLQLLTESVLLAGAGGVLGLLLAWWSFAFLQQLIPQGMALYTTLSMDLRLLGFTLLVSLITGAIFGLAPALQASKADLNDALKQGGGRAGFGGGGRRLRNAFVVGEIALALVLLVGAGLMIQTLFKLTNQYSGIRPENVLTLRTVLSDQQYQEHARRAAFYDQVLERVSGLPGVISAGYTTSVPLEWKGGSNGFSVEGRTLDPGNIQDANHRQVSFDYLQTMGIPVSKGRYFNRQDDGQAMPVAIINETMARQYWPGEDPVGKRFKLGPQDSRRPWMTIVGIAADVRQMGLDAPVKAEMYFPYHQITSHQWFAPRDLVIRASSEPTALVAGVRREIHEVDPNQPIANIRTMDEILGEEATERRMGMILLTVFASLALLLASLGIYGVLSYFVAQHTQEIGVRVALGAPRRDILGFVLKKGMTLAIGGVAIGLIAAYALTRLMASLLFDVSAADPLTFITIALLLTLVSFLACYIPARRATKVDPMVALRYE